MILYFSGTGNSFFAARRIAETLGETPVSLNARIKEGDVSPLSSETPFVVVAPTYAWKLPRIVEEHLRKTTLTGNGRIYFVLTCGSGIAGAGYYAESLSEALHKEYMGCAAVVMPENYIAMFLAPDPDRAKKITENAIPVLDRLAKAVADGVKFDTKNGSKLMSGFVNNLFYDHFIADKKFFATDKCVSCGKCVAGCPLSNITLENGRPVWHGHCSHCIACICLCPAEAVEYGRGTAKKRRYSCPL